MIALELTDVKDFMHKLLLTDTFDHFLLSEATVVTYNTFIIDGHINKEFFSEEELQEFNGETISRWSQIRPFCLQQIKGKKQPLSFKFIYLLSNEDTAKLIEESGLNYSKEDVNGLTFHISFRNNQLSCVAGISLKNFTLDKSLEQYWDSKVQEFLKKSEILYE